MSKPIVSVIMPVYNCEEFVEDAINSILLQTYTDFEFIIINDGSTDNTATILKNIADDRIKLFNYTTNKGNYARRNEGCKVAEGKYVCVMDSDDIAMPERIERQVAAMEKDPSILALGSYYEVVGEGIYAKPKNHLFIQLSLLWNNVFVHPSLMIKKDILEEIGGYNEEYYYSADYDLVCQLALKGKIANIPEILLRYRKHKNQISISQSNKQKFYADKIRLSYLNRCGFNLSDEEKEIFTKMMTPVIITNGELYEMKLLMDKLLKRNDELNLFNTLSLRLFLELMISRCYGRFI